MSDGSVVERWAVLPGPKWSSPLQAKTWLIEQRRLLGWSHKDVEKAFFDCAAQSDLYIGPGGGARFDRATEKRVARFERDGQQIPDWMYWMPLIVARAQVSRDDRWTWDRDHIPEHRDVRRDREEADYHSRLYELDDEEIALIERFRKMDGDQRAAFRLLAEPNMLHRWMDTLQRAADRDTSSIALVDEALTPPRNPA